MSKIKFSKEDKKHIRFLFKNYLIGLFTFDKQRMIESKLLINLHFNNKSKIIKMLDRPFLVAEKFEEDNSIALVYFKNVKAFDKGKAYWAVELYKDNNYSNFKGQLEHFLDNLDKDDNYIMIPCSCIGTCGILKLTSFNNGEGVEIYAQYFTQMKLNPKYISLPITEEELGFILEVFEE